MRIPRVYTDQPLALGTTTTLDGSVAHYLLRVLRLQPERELVLFNGTGGEYLARVLSVSKKQLQALPESYRDNDRESPLYTELAIGISRGERMDLVLQKATELGVSRIVPLTTERTEVKLVGERQEKKQLHWQQVSISAAEQCQRNRLPEIAPLTTLTEYLQHCQSELRFVLHHRDSKSLPASAKPTSVALLIGPEGGLSDAEINAARAANFAPLTLGPRVLRTETAPVAALGLLQYLWGDW